MPKIWEQTTYLAGGVTIHLVNLTNGQAVRYRVGQGTWRTYGGTPLVASDIFTTDNVPATLEVRCGPAGVVLRRTVIMNPDYPAPGEQHGNLLWADEAERQAVINKVHNIQPFKKSYETFRSGYYQGSGATYDDTRGSWRSGGPPWPAWP